MTTSAAAETGPDQPTESAEPYTKVLVGRALILFGLAGLAIVQPLLDLFGNNPEFFVAGAYRGSQIVWFALLIALVPPLVATAIVAAVMAIDRRAGTIAFVAIAGLLAAGFALAVLRTIGVDALVPVIVLALAAAAAIVWLVLRTAGGRLLVTYLAAANLLFVGLFLFASPASELVSGSARADVGDVTLDRPDGPVVVIILDEFPAATIMRADGTINDERYPGFAELASVSTWFRNASSPYNLTHQAVPAVLDGHLAEDGALPVYADYPENLFTLLGSVVPVHRYESVTDMCPESVCDPAEGQSLTQAFEDASIVYGHRILPGTFRDDLPPIDNSWGAYGAPTDADGGAATASSGGGDEDVDDDSGEPSYTEQAYSRWRGLSADERSPLGQADLLRSHIEAITDDPALHFVHVAIPHRPWVLTPSGLTTSFAPPLIRDEQDPAFEFENRMEYQFHSMQVGAADTLVALLLERLQALPNWEDTLLVVTSDHGSNLTPPDLGRMRITDANVDEALRVPLFIKAPGQTEGEVRDDPALNIDVLPSIVDLLDADVDWEFDGHSLFDGSEPTVEPRVSPDVDAVIEIAARRAETFPHGDDWVALAAVGPNGDLVGDDVGDHTVGEPSDVTIAIDQAEQFASLPTPEGQVPVGLSGTVSAPSEPPELLVAINGRLAGVIGGYTPAGDGWTFLGFVADLYVDGANEVVVYEVTRDGDDVTLHEVAHER